ncbi:LacI family transcriptional regulator [Limosilactobacillus coleohominis DSM 14060]|nr:LacI family transcriptional regulator [Limosilactobacillus coleohominis DSM 14060]
MNNDNSVTIQTIAKKAHVSHTTVSRALNGSDLVKPETRRLIHQIADELGYVPNYNARSLVTKHSNMVGIFFTNLETGTSASFLTEVITQVQEKLPPQYAVAINSISAAEAGPQISLQNYDGVIIISQSDSDKNFIQSITKKNIPAVVLNRNIQSDQINNYSINDFLGSKIATQYAIRMGHRRFALIEGVEEFTSSQERSRGFKEALKEAGIPIETAIIQRGDYRPQSGNEIMRKILSSGENPTCVICENDDMATGAISACAELSYKVSEDISIIGFDDMPYSQYLTPPLTTVRKPTDEIIESGVNRLIKLMKGNHSNIQKQVYNPEIIVRSSVKRLN